MDNAASALRMGGAIMFFVLAFTLMMNLYNQSKHTMDKVLYSVDERNYYQHVGATKANITRIVGVDTIIPTLYSYVSSTDGSVRVNIVDKSGHLVQVFDHSIENKVGNESTKGTSSEYFNKVLLNRYNKKDTKLYMFEAPWFNGDNSTKIDRVTAYIYGRKMRINDAGTVDYEDNNLLKLASTCGGKFEEKYIDYQSSGTVYWDADFEESLVLQSGKTKTVITYKAAN